MSTATEVATTEQPAAKEQPTTAELLVELRLTTDAVRGKAWLSGEITGSTATLSALGSTENPLTGLSGAGLDWLMPMVSFLEEPLNQLRGNPDPVAAGADGFDGAGRDTATVADDYRRSTTEETDEWAGEAADGYRAAGAQQADGLAALGEASTTVASAVAGAGEVVAQVVDIVTRLVAEAVGKIVPIMTQAVAAAPATFGQSIVAAIPQCVGIAVDYGQRILGKLAALLASGDNLLKLVDAALAVLDLVKQVLTPIGQQSTQPEQQQTTQPEDQQTTEPDDQPSTDREEELV
ncbi:WXG100 family type VII secretion target [Actinophytocola gossypii]|uniref:ESX-1 secretion-associated protein EspA/EspE-like domain-containing protein n=1 Tax=Actinophytocola gossypii TaxID=2812003 RepID=A0ABT2J3C5_9PSEU|nr:hypothetical protein [Actinophytocola gossypii]MCT2582347.1 hypothetical protein [Actinophytocola gossypii]